MPSDSADRQSLRRFAWLSMAAAVVTVGLKLVAYLVTGSVGLLSDALESVVNLAGAAMALVMLTIAARPADEEHAYGHSKAEYFASGAEGSLIVAAALTIAISATERLTSPRPLEQIGVGLAIAVAASAVNLVAALVILRAGRLHRSITLEANAHHLFTDVWTSGGILVGIAAVGVTGWWMLDPLVALLVAGNIVWTGFRIVRTSVRGLMDVALPSQEIDRIRAVIDSGLRGGAQYHALRTRQSAARRFVSFHVLVPGNWTVHEGHQLLEQLERDIRAVLPAATVFTHLESLDDPASWEDETLDRRFPSN